LDTESRRGLFNRLKELLLGNRASSSEELEREIQDLVDQGEAQGFISGREADMIEAVLQLSEITADQIMMPRTELAMVPQSASVADTIAVIVESGHSRIPVYSEDPDHIVGVIHAKDILPFWNRNGDVALDEIMRPPFFVPQAMPVNELMAAFRRRRVHLAVVVDEYGGTAGVVTLEDVLEEIVGEIEDEYDQEEQLIAEQADGSLLVEARLEIEELSKRLGVELPDSLPEGRFETVGGFITTLLGRVPRPQQEVEYGPLRFVVTGADERRVTQVQVHHIAGSPQTQSEN
jgi:CBS domain containing-hemolysin-like protein